MAEKLENGVDLIVSTAPCLVSSDQNVLRMKLGNEKDLGPVTHILDGEKVELLSSSDRMEDEDLALGCQTPTESIFNPFAPGPEELILAPKKKMMKETRIPLRRQLNFEFCIESVEDDDDDAEEDRFLELVRKSFFDLIISNQLREMSAEKLFVESNTSEAFKTPTSLPLLTGIAETCPAAPMRPGLKSRKLSEGICRKLEFGTNLL